MARELVLDLHEGEYRARLYRWGPKRYQLYLQRDDATVFTYQSKELPLPFGVVKARAAALAYWEMWKIKEGVTDGNE